MGNANPASPAEAQQPSDPESTATYVAELSGSLAYMARSQGLDTLGYILEMAKLEAESTLRGTKRR